MNSYFYHPNLKKFWIELIKNAIEYYEFEGDFEHYPDWERSINEATTFEKIDKIGRKLRREIGRYGKKGGIILAWHILGAYEEKNLKEVAIQDLTEAEKGIRELESELQEEEELVDIKNERIFEAKKTIDNLKKEVFLWKTKYYKEKKRVIYYSLQLAKDQGKVKKLRESETELKKTKKKLEQIIREKDKQHDKTKKQKTRLNKKLGRQTVNLLRLKQRKSEVEGELIKTTKKNKSLEKKLATFSRQRNVARNKLNILKNKQRSLKSVAESKHVPPSLIKSESITNGLLNKDDNSLIQAIENTNDSLIDVVAKTQQYLKIDDLTLIVDSHPMPPGKTLTDLINFYNNPPLGQNPQPVNYNNPSHETQPISPLINNPVGLPIIKEVFKDNPEQVSEIAKLKQNIQKLEEELRKQKGVIISKDKMVMERFILYFLLFLLLAIALASMLQKKKKNEKGSKTIRQIKNLREKNLN